MSDAASEIDDLRPRPQRAPSFRASFFETRDRFAELTVTADEAKSPDELLPLLETAVRANGPSSACTTLTDLAAERLRSICNTTPAVVDQRKGRNARR
jgi:hypothetical protein